MSSPDSGFKRGRKKRKRNFGADIDDDEPADIQSQDDMQPPRRFGRGDGRAYGTQEEVVGMQQKKKNDTIEPDEMRQEISMVKQVGSKRHSQQPQIGAPVGSRLIRDFNQAEPGDEPYASEA